MAAEAVLSWKRMFFCSSALLVVTFLFNDFPRRESVPPLQSIPSASVTQPLEEFSYATGYNEGIDGLTEAQCATTFPELYSDIDRAVAHWKSRQHTILPKDIETEPHDATMRILIHGNQLRILSSAHAVDRTQASPDRAMGVVYLLQRAMDSALAAGETLPTIEASLNFRDDAELPEGSEDTHSYWTFARTIGKEAHQRSWLMPNFDFWYYKPTGSFADSKYLAIWHDDPFTSKIPKVVWRGNAGFNEGIRGSLLEVTKGKEWADIAEVHFNEDPPVAMDVDQFCRYAMTVYTEGVTYSGRLKFLMNCASLLIVHEPAYVTHYSHLLVGDGPKQNCVVVKRDWSDLEEKVGYYLAHPEEAEKIIENSLLTFRSRYTTRAANSCYLRRLITSYASVSFTPKVYIDTEFGATMRGVSFEEFLDHPEDKQYGPGWNATWTAGSNHGR